MKAVSVLPLTVILLSLLPAAGCKKHGAKTNVIKVSGTVTLDGVPLEKGTIMFASADKMTEPAQGEIKAGQFVLEAPPGPKIVKIDANKVVGTRKRYEGDPNSSEVDVTESVIPAKYNARSELKVDINPGNNQLPPFELTSR